MLLNLKYNVTVVKQSSFKLLATEKSLRRCLKDISLIFKALLKEQITEDIG